MRRELTLRAVGALVLLAALPGLLSAQTGGVEWRHIGNTLMDSGLAGLSTGPVDRVWYAPDGSRLIAVTRSGRAFQTDDFEQWKPLSPVPLPPVEIKVPASAVPDPSAKLRTAAGGARLYALGQATYRSEDGGGSWSNLTMYRGKSILGALRDLAASPRDADEIVVAGDSGVWRSLDGGLSWSGLNQFLPNLPVRRIMALPNGMNGLRTRLAVNSSSAVVEWAPGEKSAWKVVQDAAQSQEETLKLFLSSRLGVPITAVATLGSAVYAGSGEGQLWASLDGGATWSTPSERVAGPVESIVINPEDGRMALVALAARAPAFPLSKAPRVLRTMNGGIFWDDMTANLPDVPAHGVTADFQSGAVYAATDAGLFMTFTDLNSAGRATAWMAVSGPRQSGPVMDVKLDAGGNQLFITIDGYGVFAAIAPHRLRNIRVVSAADFSSRAASPGGLLSVIGAKVQAAQAANTNVPVLASTELTSQIQIPFDVKGNLLSLSLESASGRVNVGLALQSASPAIFVDPDGAPLVLDSESGILLDHSKPARARSRIQILAAGLGRVKPDWPAGLAAPLSDPPQVDSKVKVYLDRIPLEVTRAILAPGYIGFYLVEAEIPAIVNEGPGELYMEVEGQASNRVRIYLAQ